MEIIEESIKTKSKIVTEDEKESGIRAILNFGHTFAHAYEASLGFSKKLNHGEAVILGMKSALSFSLKNNLLNKNDYNYTDISLDNNNNNNKKKNNNK